MRAVRIVAGLTTIVAAALGLSLVSAGPAAADSGTWAAYGSTNPITSSPSMWTCAPTRTIATSVAAQVCVVRSVDATHVQAAVVVRNNRSAVYSVSAEMDLADTSGDFVGYWKCPPSGVGSRSWSVCFGKTLPYNYCCVDSEGAANGVYLGITPYA